MTETTNPLMKRITSQEGPLLLPGANNALTARLIEEEGFEAVYLSGAGISNTYLGSPDIGLLTVTELVSHVGACRDAVDIPIIVDADTGFGNAVNIRRTVRDLSRAGANGIQIEDQVMPKRCGHFSGKEVIAKAEMLGKIQSALDARLDERLVIIARTDSRAILGLSEACDRAQAYLEAGADVAFVEAPVDRSEIAQIPKRVDGPLLINVVEGGLTPHLSFDELKEMGYNIVLYANSAMRGSIVGARAVLAHLKSQGSTQAVSELLVDWQERQRLVRKPFFDNLQVRYGNS